MKIRGRVIVGYGDNIWQLVATFDKSRWLVTGNDNDNSTSGHLWWSWVCIGGEKT